MRCQFLPQLATIDFNSLSNDDLSVPYPWLAKYYSTLIRWLHARLIELKCRIQLSL